MIPRVRDKDQIAGLDEMLEWCISILGNSLVVVEVGCYLGESTERFLFRPEIRMLFCVDFWNDDFYNSQYGLYNGDEKNIETLFDKTIEPYTDRATKIKNTSVNASKTFDDYSLDMVYIDADHKYESVTEDIACWLPKIKQNGIICGHDYIGYRGVYDAVSNKFGFPDAIFFDSSWAKKILW